jgi:hypothetical protein
MRVVVMVVMMTVMITHQRRSVTVAMTNMMMLMLMLMIIKEERQLTDSRHLCRRRRRRRRGVGRVNIRVGDRPRQGSDPSPRVAYGRWPLVMRSFCMRHLAARDNRLWLHRIIRHCTWSSLGLLLALELTVSQACLYALG